MIMKRLYGIPAETFLSKTYLESGLNREEIRDCIASFVEKEKLDVELVYWELDEIAQKALPHFFANGGAKLKHKDALKKFIKAYLFKVEYARRPLKTEYLIYLLERLDTLRSIEQGLSPQELADLYVSISYRTSNCPKPKFDLLYKIGNFRRASFEEGLRAKKNGFEILGIYPFRDCDWAISLKEGYAFDDQGTRPTTQQFAAQIPDSVWKNGGVDVKEINLALFILGAPILSGQYWYGVRDIAKRFVVSDNKCSMDVDYGYLSLDTRKYRNLYYFREETPLEKEVRLMKEELDRQREYEAKQREREYFAARDRLNAQRFEDHQQYLKSLGCPHWEGNVEVAKNYRGEWVPTGAQQNCPWSY